MRLLRENLRQQAPTYAVAIIAMVVIAITASLTAWLMRDIIDAMMSTGSKSEVYAVAVAIAAVFIVKGVATYVQLVFMGRAGNSIVANLQKRLFERILQHGVSFFSEGGGSSDLLMRVTNSANGARQVINTIVTGFVRDALTLIGLVFVMFYQQPLLSLVCLLAGPIALFGIRRILARVKEIVSAQMGGLSVIIKTVQETSSGIRVVKAFDLEGTMRRRMDGAIKEVQGLSNSIVRLEAATSPLMETLGGLAIASVVALSTIELFGQSGNSAGRLMSFITAVLMAYEPAKRLAKMRVNIEVGMVMASMMYQVLDMPIAMTEKEDAKPLPEGPGRIKLENAGFSYGSGVSIIKDLNLDIEPGTTTAFVGPSGGGKSTIINLILRLYDPTSGAISVDGMDLKEASFTSIRNKISFVGQDTFLFSGTVWENIEMGRQGASEEEIIAAAKTANAHEFIESLDGGYYADVGENGGRLSGGQRQRISIARAILRESPILLMDEATSALDATTEYEVQQALENLSAGRTTIVIAHRLSTILNADRIIVIEDGAIVEDGKLEQLVEQNGIFRKLYDHQFSRAEVS
ncbi:MAG: ABC transporter ATP-binding protein [Tateyamaria sp.]|uniref:ABC transporter ATP-binding protein n=1 Tax=Tateyamaria sp. TaxID=1929288 RepID=UPI00329DB5D6